MWAWTHHSRKWHQVISAQFCLRPIPACSNAFSALQKPRVLLALWPRQKLFLGYTEELGGALIDYCLDPVVANNQFEYLRRKMGGMRRQSIQRLPSQATGAWVPTVYSSGLTPTSYSSTSRKGWSMPLSPKHGRNTKREQMLNELQEG